MDVTKRVQYCNAPFCVRSCEVIRIHKLGLERVGRRQVSGVLHEKRHIFVVGLLLLVHPADIQDRDGGVRVLKTLFGRYPFLKKLFADGGYQGPVFAKGLKKAMPGLATAIVKRSDTARGFEVLPRRWMIERTFAWLGRCRRLAKDFENLSRNALAFLKLAPIRLMLRRLCSN